MRLSALQARNMSPPAIHSRFATSVPALPSSSGSKRQLDGGRPVRAARWRSDHVRQVVQVDEDLVDTRSLEGVEPNVE